MKIQKQTENFLKTFKAQREAGLIVLTSSKDFSDVEEEMIKDKFTEAKDWKQVLKHLSLNQSVFLYINSEFTKEYYDLLKQYSERGGMIQIMNPDTMNYETINFDPFQAHFILLITKDALGWAEEKFSIRDKVGLMEIIA